MGYATPEMTAQLIAAGFEAWADGFVRRDPGGSVRQRISPHWPGKFLHPLRTPEPHQVAWLATQITSNTSIPVDLVVAQEDATSDPVQCFVLAELRGWKNKI